MSDPVASQSGFLCRYMSNHPDTLVAYVRHYGGVKQDVKTAEMTSIDTKSMTLKYTLKAGGSPQEIKVAFNPPLSGSSEVKNRLITMKSEAEEALGMTRAPEITTFELPTRVYYTAPLVAFMFYTYLAPETASPSYAPLLYLAHATRSVIPWWFINASWYFMIVVHFLEALYTLRLCRKHRTPFWVGFQYVFFTFLLGFPILTDFQRKVQEARINSILKTQ
ncbi:hypothetical protein K474DRAFT_1620141 [Panus rudis PR-1116 ss-1]|nr:hypothetical protein K474DRAFT_1620141 [Panus rudis PR-1116 ss-1]